MKKLFTPKQKASIALEAVKGLETLNQLASRYEAHPIQIGIWKKQLSAHAHLAFAGSRKEDTKQQDLIDRLYRIVDQGVCAAAKRFTPSVTETAWGVSVCHHRVKAASCPIVSVWRAPRRAA